LNNIVFLKKNRTQGTFTDLEGTFGPGTTADDDVYLVEAGDIAPGAFVLVSFDYQLAPDASGFLAINYEGATENYRYSPIVPNARKRQVTTDPFTLSLAVERLVALDVEVRWFH